MVIAGMKPLISSCFTVTSLCAASSDWTWPCSVNVRGSGALLQPAANRMRPSDKTKGARISSSVDDLDRHLWLQLPGVEGELLSGRPRDGEDAALLRRALSHRRDQLHLLPDAEREDRVRMGGADAVAVQADAEGAAAHHPRQPAETGGRARAGVLPGRGHARRQAGRAAVPAAAEPEKRSGAVRRVPRHTAAEGL